MLKTIIDLYKSKLSDNKSDLKVQCLDFNKIFQNKTLISKLRKLTICYVSGMNYELNKLTDLALKRRVKAKVITVSKDKTIIGWALLSKEATDFWGYNSFLPKDGILFEIFVDPKFRRIGAGSALIKKARKHAGSAQLCIAPHDTAGYSFYKKHNKYKQKQVNI